MNERLIDEVLAEVKKRQQTDLPRALLVGREPPQNLGWQYVGDGEHAAVVVGSMSAYDLLQFPDAASANALLQGKPVYVCESGLEYRRHSRTANRALWSRLLAAERQLKQLGVQFLRESNDGKLLTAEEVRRRLREGLPIEGRLTPLARDVLEGKQ